MIEPSADPPERPTSETDAPPPSNSRPVFAAEACRVSSEEPADGEHDRRPSDSAKGAATDRAANRSRGNANNVSCQRERRRSPLAQWCDERVLNPAEQVAAAVLTAIALMFVALWWVWQGAVTGRTIDVDRAPPVPISFVVNVNEADWPELSQLPGIGPVLAQRIVASRAQDGPFRSVDDLRRVQGIGPITIERLRPHVATLLTADSLADGTDR